jgi:hypothetical protein
MSLVRREPLAVSFAMTGRPANQARGGDSLLGSADAIDGT